MDSDGTPRTERLPADELPPGPEHDEAGVDLTLVRAMLARSPLERLLTLQSAALAMDRLRRARHSV